MSLVTFFILDPINMYTTKNMFLRYLSADGINEDIGLIVNISQGQNIITVHHFMSWRHLLTFAGDLMMPNVSFWPLNTHTNPLYLCNSDVLVDVHIDQVKGLAFVVNVDDSIVPHIHGMAHTHAVSLCFNSAKHTIRHI
jgi:hypothetical protein